MNNLTKQFLYLVLTLFTLVAGYAYLRYAYKVTDSTPFTQEIVLTILGTLATIFITALLLNKQTAVEIEKEQSIKFLDLKAKTYERLLDLLEEISLSSDFSTEDVTRMQFVTHRLAIFSSADVLDEYNRFLGVLKEISKDGSLKDDMPQLSEALGELTVKIRYDLLNERYSDKEYSKTQIKNLIANNSDRLSHFKIIKKRDK